MEYIYIVCDYLHVNGALATARDSLQRICHIDMNVGKLAAWCKNVVEPSAEFVASYGEFAWKSNLNDVQRGLKILGTPFGS